MKIHSTIFLFLSFAINAQITFQKTFGGAGFDIGHSVQQTNDGGYILFGQTNSFGSGAQDMYLIKIDDHGIEQWAKTYGGANWEFGICARQTSDNGFILCGGYSGLGNDSLALIKTDVNGNEIWNKHYSGSVDREVGQFVQQTSDGGFIAVGFTGAGSINIYLIKTDSNGNEVWNKVYNNTGIEYGVGIRQTLDGGFAIIGQTNSKGHGGKDIYLLKTNSSGDTLWTKTYGTPSDEIGRSVYLTSDGGYILLGYEDFWGGDAYMVKTDAVGNEQWHKYYGGTGWDFAHCVQQTLDGGYILGGRKENISAGTNEMYCVKTDNTGNVSWELTYPQGILSDANTVQQTSDGGYVLFGSTTDASGVSDMFLVKTASNGVISVFENELNASRVVVYPNPFNEYSIVEFENPDSKNYNLIITDVQGRVIKHIDDIKTNRIRVERNTLVNGMYFYQLISGNKLFATGKLIVE